MNYMPEIISVPNYGQVGAGTVVEFTPRPDKMSEIVRPNGTTSSDAIYTHTVSGESLHNPLDRKWDIYNGDTLICKGNFDISEVTPNKICIVFIHTTCERIAKKVRYEDGMIVLSPTNPAFPVRTYPADDVEIVGIVVAFQRNWL